VKESLEIQRALTEGRARFLDFEMMVAHGALVPRAETELLARVAIAAANAASAEAPTVIDMCTGSGNVACAIARHASKARVFASDLTDATVALARRNAELLGQGRVTVAQGDLFSALAGMGLHGEVDVITCNPPYISQGKLAKDSAHLLSQEPREAFEAGPYGISIHQRVVQDALPFLKVGGTLLFEIGLGQDRQVIRLLERAKAYESIELHKDPEGNPRVVAAVKGTKPSRESAP